tara:strand:- start:201 stop:1751 length:1551 start_codon:yes stop_codon:yes gene_type:complete
MSTKTYILLYLFYNFLSISFAQVTPPEIEWQNALGGSEYDSVYAIRNTLDGGYVVAGRIQSSDGDITGFHGGIDIWVVKLNSEGDLQWQKALGGSNSDIGRSIQPTSDGGVIVAGSTNSTDGDITNNIGGGDIWLVKLDNTGNIEWEKTYGGTNDEWPNFIKQTTDGGFIIAGGTVSDDGDISGHHGMADAWVFKINQNGDFLWQTALGGSEWDTARAIKQTSDGGYIVGASSESNDGDVSVNQGIDDFWFIKLSSNGTIEWEKTYGGSESEIIRGIEITPDGGYIASGYTDSNDGDISFNYGDRDYWIVKITSTGNLEWEKTFGGSDYDLGDNIHSTIDGYAMVGYTYSSDGDVLNNQGIADIWMIKINEFGDIQWQKSLGGSDTDFTDSESLQLTADGGYVIAGYTVSNDGDVSGNNGSMDYWVVKLSPDNLNILENDNVGLSVFPNPARNFIVIDSSAMIYELNIYSVSGELLMSKNIAKSNSRIDISTLSSGIYILEILNENIAEKVKLIKQ